MNVHEMENFPVLVRPEDGPPYARDLSLTLKR